MVQIFFSPRKNQCCQNNFTDLDLVLQTLTHMLKSKLTNSEPILMLLFTGNIQTSYYTHIKKRFNPIV